MSLRPLDALLTYCPTGTAEGDASFIHKAFVRDDDFIDIITPPPSSPRLVVGKKGSGKTAIMRYAADTLTQLGCQAILLTPRDIQLDASKDDSVAALSRMGYEALMRAIAIKIGTTLGGLLNGQDKQLHDTAVNEGYKSPDMIERLASILPRLAKSLIKLDFTSEKPGKATSEALRNAVDQNLARTNGAFFLFFDDTDQVSAPAQPGQLNRIWGMLLAIRDLCGRIPTLRSIVSMREEVWRRLTRDNAGQRDQADHFVSLVRYLSPTRHHIREIISRRLELARDDLAVHLRRSPIETFFERDMAKMPSSDELRSWEDLIVVRSRERPRDAIQLINLLGSAAKQRRGDRINDQDLVVVMPNFSAQRVLYLAQEIDLECPQIREIVESLADVEYDQGTFKAKADVIRNHLLKLPSAISITLFGRPVRPEVDNDAFDIWRLLFEIGVLNARVSDKREKDGFRHVPPAEDPGLINKSRWNDLQAMVWEVHPAFRDHLIKIQNDEAARLGLPKSKPKRKRR